MSQVIRCDSNHPEPSSVVASSAILVLLSFRVTLSRRKGVGSFITTARLMQTGTLGSVASHNERELFFCARY
jgi:hypothetical protein